MSNALALSPVVSTPSLPPSRGIDFFDPKQFEHAERIATLFANSTLVPDVYKQKPGNCMIALDVAGRCGASPMMVMQNLHIIHGKPTWGASYIIAAINASGRYTPLRFEVTVLGEVQAGGKIVPNKQCIAYAWERHMTDQHGKKEFRLESAPVSVEMAVKEGWYTKNGSKWQAMTDLMLQYRAATWFGRMYAPEILMGMQSQEEVLDIEATQVDPAAEKLAEKIGLPAPSEEPKRRARKGAGAAVDAPPEKATDLQPSVPPPSEPVGATPAPNENPAPAPATSTPAPVKEEPKTETPAPADSADYVFEIVEKVAVNAPNAEVWTKITTNIEPQQVFWKKAPDTLPNVGVIVNGKIGTQLGRNDPTKKLYVLSSFEVLGG